MSVKLAHSPLFLLMLVHVVRSSPHSGGSHVCHRTIYYTQYYTETYKTNSGWWTGNHDTQHTRTKTRRASRIDYYCCDGWKQRHSSDSGCDEAVCYSSSQSTTVPCNDRGHCAGPNKCTCYTGYTGSRCDSCLDAYGDPEHSIYWHVNSHPDCKLTCSWKSHWCWPGDCPDRRLKTSCTCRQGFRKIDGGTSYTKCDLSTPPEFQTCHLKMTASGNRVRSSTTGATNTGCRFESDTYVNLKPRDISFDIMSTLKSLNISKPPVYITHTGLGIVAGRVVVLKQSVSGRTTTLNTDLLNTGTGCLKTVSDRSPSRDLNCSHTMPVSTNLNDGERICVKLSTSSGGYYEYEDFHGHPQVTQNFTRISSEKQLCFRYDSSKPVHCSQQRNKCTSPPLDLSTRITRSNVIKIHTTGWTDPVSSGGTLDTASGLAYSKIQILGMKRMGYVLDVDNPPMKKEEYKGTFTLNVDMALPEKSGLYAVLLEVVDKAGNTEKVRRFVLYDKDSIITTDPSKPLRITSAKASNNYVWQSNHGPVCLDWSGRYFNDHFKDNNPLLPIVNQSKVEVAYDQTSGPMSVTGTTNVNGITEAYYSFSVDKGTFSSWKVVPNFTKQSTCLRPNLLDGQTYTIQLNMTDIVKNSFTESVIVHIDSTVPDISHMWLVKDGHKQIYVHDSLDLSTMVLQFGVTDPHSGVKFVEWYLGTKDQTQDLGHGVLPVQKLNGTNCPSTPSCYCPSVGQCQYSNYTVTLNKLVDNKTNTGQHNQEFYFTVVATNEGDLKNIDHLDILVDNSPPEIGSVKEGSTGGPDVDYTSEETVLVNWAGFIDHESGINHYLVALEPKCLTIAEIESSNATFIPAALTEAKFSIPTGGTFFASVVAYNEALNPSKVACSDGITKDTSPPVIYNVSLSNAKTSDHVLCYDGSAWLVSGNLTMKKLTTSPACQSRCINSGLSPLADILPRDTVTLNDTDLADNICRNLPYLDKLSMIYLPSDKILLTWNYSETESQIREFSVGFGSDLSAQQDPDLLGYKSTKGNLFFKSNHAGFAGKTVFYIFVKAENKAGLEAHAIIGPVTIDYTPPVAKETLMTETHGDYVYVKWHNTTFEDLEQADNDYMVLFRIVHNGHHVTPILQSPEAASKSCQDKGYAGCVRYPLESLQQMDSELNKPFLFELYVYNAAEHFSVIHTDEFHVKSRFPPGHGIVHDLDPGTLEHQEDVDYHISPNTACIQWSGFYHHAGVTFETAFGISPNTSDVIAFQTAASDNQTCVTSSSLQPRTKYYATVRATCSGGITYASSDGFVIIDRPKDDTFLTLFDGVGCKNMKNIESISLIPLSNSSATSTRGLYTTADRLHIGQTYTVLYEQDLHFVDSNIILLSKVSKNSLQFIPLLYYPTFNITPSKNNNTSQAPTINMCTEDEDYQISRSTKSFHWVYHGPLTSFTTHFEVKLEEETQCSNGSKCFITVDTKQIKASANDIDFTNVNLHQGKRYLGTIRPCFDKSCLDWVSSDGVAVVSDKVKLGMSANFQHLHGNDCDALSITVDYIDCQEKPSDKDHIIFQWSTADRHESLVEPWKIMQGLLKGKVTVCLTSKPMSRDDLQICLRATCPSGLTTMVCDAVPERQHLDSHKALIETSIKSIEGIGEMFDIDYAESFTEVAGVLKSLEGRNGTWYIMMKPQLPTTDCETDKECITTVKSTGSVVKFSEVSLNNNERYFICVHAPKQQSSGGSALPEISQCGDGFIIDNDPPTRGDVHILNQKDGFLTQEHLLVVTWTEFTDYEAHIPGSTASGIANFSYSVGTTPGGQDVIQTTGVGFVHNVHIAGVPMKSGKTYFVTITATDYLGHVTTATSDPVNVDVTPPVPGTIFVDSAVESHMAVSSNNLLVNWDGFHDEESGIASFQISLSSKETSEIIPFKEYTGSFAKLPTQGKLVDGHKYFVKIETTNRAGLSSVAVSPTFIFDRSPPVVGVVRDGDNVRQTENDYQIYTDNLTCHWTNFHDPHSGLSYFWVGLGTLPHTDDVETMTHVGLRSDLSWTDNLPLGTKLYCSVEACNNAGLCSRSASDGIILDNSPPVPGVVFVGSDGHHHKYHGHVSTIAVSWFDFEDPQTGINHFDWCIGSAPGDCDILDKTNNLLSDSVIKTGLNLPLGKPLYVTVNATNPAGLVSSSTSDSFIVDDSPPTVVKTPVFLSPHISKEQAITVQWENSMLKLAWKFQDTESQIKRHLVSLSTHHDSTAAVENVHLGAQDTATILFDENSLMRSGDTYTAVVTACNAAGLCSSASSAGILIDSTPPGVGGVKLPLTWETIDYGGRTGIRLHLRWYGFSDVESGISFYNIFVSRTYDDSELSGGMLMVKHNVTQEDQMVIMDITDKVGNGENITVTLAAVNKAGLSSKPGKVTLTVVASDMSHTKGKLDIQRHSCSVEYCTGDCTCAIVGKRCPVSNQQCTDISSSLNQTMQHAVEVFPGLTMDESMTNSASCLTGHWHVGNKIVLQHIKRFEWSMGQTGHVKGFGIFDSRKEEIWYSVGKKTQIILCLQNGKALKHNTDYVIYLRVWFSFNEFAVFESHSLHVDHTPPSIRAAKSLLDSDDHCKNDREFYRVGETVKTCWDSVFQDTESSIGEYEYWLGTFPEGNDVQDVISLGSQTSYNIPAALLKTGTKYYASIRATNNAGLQTTSVTDGFVVDDVPPVAGVVFTTDHHRNIRAQASNTTLRLSWHSFADYHSYIERFEVAVLERGQSPDETMFNYFGLENELVLNGLKLDNGKSYRVAVRAEDAAGLTSDIAYSPTIKIDATPPFAFECTSYLAKQDLKFESQLMTAHGMTRVVINTSHTVTKGTLYELIVTGEISVYETQITFTVGRLSVNGRFEGTQHMVESSHSFISEENGKTNISVIISGQNVSELVKVYIRECQTLSIANPKNAVRVRQIRPSVVAVCTNIMDPESDLKSVWMGAGTSKGGYQIWPLSPTAVSNHEMILVQEPHGSPVYVTVMAENRAGLRTIYTSSPIVIDHTAPEVTVTTVNINYGHASDDVISLDVSWQATDEESNIEVCYCAADMDAHATSTSWQEVHDKGHCIIYNISAHHNSLIYARVKCINSVNLETTSSSKSLRVLHHSPVLPQNSLKVLVDNQISTGHLSSRAQAYTDHVEFFWRGTEKDGVAYECRLMDGSVPVTNWNSTGARTHCRLDGLSLMDGHVYEAQVRATDGRHQYSQPLNASVVVESRSPVTTGKKPEIHFLSGDVTVGWSNVFDVINMDVVYTVSMGTRQGYADIVNQLVTKDTQLTARAEENLPGVYLTVTAQIETGKFGLLSEFMVLDAA